MSPEPSHAPVEAEHPDREAQPVDLEQPPRQSLNEELSTVNMQLQAKMDELQDANNDLNSLLASTNIAVLFLDTNLCIRRYTPAVTALIDLIATDVGRPLTDLNKKFEDAALALHVQQVLETVVPMEAEVTGHDSRQYLRRVLPYRTVENRIEGIVITFVDITTRKKAEDELREAKVAAERENKLKEEFMAALAHELRTPVSAILLWTKMILDSDGDDATIKEGIEAISRTAQAQKTLVDDLLDRARITSGKLRLQPREVDIAACVKAAIDSNRPSATAKKIVVTADLDDIGKGTVDPDRLRQMLWNVLVNAVKFTPEGGRVSVTLRRQKQHMVIGVADTGRGMTAEFIASLFDGGQHHGIAGDRQAGLGLGLAITRQLAELHHGTIRAQSDGPGQGTTITLELPLDLPATGGNGGGKEAATPTIPGVRILLVEDDADNRTAMLHLLNRAGARVTAAGTAGEALAVFENAKADIILSDIGLPDEDGRTLLRHLREREKGGGRKPSPAIALTAFARAEDRRSILAAGFDHFMSKPVDLNQLIGLILSLVKNGK